MQTEQHLQNLTELKKILARNTRFLSFSGLAGVIAGVIALLGEFIAVSYYQRHYPEIQHMSMAETPGAYYPFIMIALVVVVLSVGIGTWLTRRNMKIEEGSTNHKLVQNTLVNILVPIVIGGVLCLVAMYRGEHHLLASFMLLFYGLGLFGGSKYSFDDLKSMGLRFMVLGVITFISPSLSLWTWAAGFGIFHILYGLRIYLKHRSRSKQLV